MKISMLYRFALLLLLLAVLLPGQFLPNQFIVEFSEAPALRTPNRLAALRARHAAAEQELRARGFRPLARMERVANAILVEGDEQSLAALESLPGVAKLHLVREFKMTLDTAAIVHHVPEVIRAMGESNAGAGLKIGILDSGIEIGHPGFQPGKLEQLPGFPKANNERDLAYTNAKVIVARSYASLFARTDPDPSPLDRSGHGTAVAMAAAGTPHDSPRGPISGMAPAARLGVYKIFGTPGVNNTTTDGAILAAIEDAVADGMDILNLSFGSPLAGRPEDDIIVRAIARAEEAGVMVVASAGNDGPGPATLGSPATAPAALTVGASENSRLFSSAVIFQDEPLLARNGSLTPEEGSLSARLVSVAALDATELACSPLPANSLRDKAVLIVRGECTFEVKVSNATAAGAVAVVLYSDAARANEFITPALNEARLPTVFLMRADGLRLRNAIENEGEIAVQLDFAMNPRTANPNRVASFSSRGALPGTALKPDVLAVGTNVYTAAQSNNDRGDVYSRNGYVTINGTSFSAPIAAGITALLKTARPGLSPADYRSLLINSATQWAGRPWEIEAGGAGRIHLGRALESPLVFAPASIQFWADEHWIAVRNLNSDSVLYRMRVESFYGIPASLNDKEIFIEGNSVEHFRVSLPRQELEAGIHSGVVIFEAEGKPTLRFPYWFGKANPASAASIQSYVANLSATANTTHRNLLFFRALDTNGLIIAEPPAVRMITGSGSVNAIQRRDAVAIGAFGVEVVLGLGQNIVEVDAGNGIRTRFTLTGR